MADEFEWDDAKAASNWLEHGVRFAAARDAFNDPFSVEWVDADQNTGERRLSMVAMVDSRLLFIAFTMRDDRIRIISARKPNPMNDANTTPKADKHDWSRLDAMTEAEVHAAALSDPNAQPLTDADFARMKQVPRAKSLRRALCLTQEEFAARFRVPLGTLRDWEQGRTEPDQPARAYLKVIAFDAELVRRALEYVPGDSR